jgi:hypothetical protein
MSDGDKLANILLRLRGSDARVQYFGALILRFSPDLVESGLVDLIAAMNSAERNEQALVGEEMTHEKGIITWGSASLSEFVQNQPRNQEGATLARQQLLKSAQSRIGWVAATGMHWIGELRNEGAYAWDVLLQTCQGPGNDVKKGQFTLRAIAYRALLKIDAARTLSLGELPAKLEFEPVLLAGIEDLRANGNPSYLEQ